MCIASLKAPAALTILGTMSVFGQTGPSFLRKDLVVPGQFGMGELGGPNGRIVTGDFNGDGRADLIVTGGISASVLLNRGAGEFDTGAAIPLPGSCGRVEPVDLNSDGKLDLVGWCNGRTSVLLGRGDATFSPARAIPGFEAYGIETGDFNLDGKPDIVSDDGVVLLGNGDGAFGPGRALLPSRVYGSELAVADFNNDGKPDIAGLATVFSARNGDISVFPGRGDGTFGAPVISVRPPAVPEPNRQPRLLAADLNGDGALDILTGWHVLLGNKNGSFQPPRQFFQPVYELGRPVPVAAADFDGDGHMDVVVASRHLFAATDLLLIFRGRGDGSLAAPAEYRVGWQPSDAVVADFDGDGRPDIATANTTANSVSLLLSASAADPRQTRAVSAASGTAVVAPGSIATLHVSAAVNGANLEVRDRNGNRRFARLLYVAGTQINFLVPEDTAIGEATLTLVTEAGSTQVGTMQVEPVAPGLFLMTGYSLTPAAFQVRVARDGSTTTNPLFDCLASQDCEKAPFRWEPEGSFLTFYGTGFRNATPANVRVRYATEEWEVAAAGPHSAIPGLDVITVRIQESEYLDPWRLQFARFTTEVVASIDRIPANRVLLSFELQP